MKEQIRILTHAVLGCHRCVKFWDTTYLVMSREWVPCPVCGMVNGIAEAVKRGSEEYANVA